MSSGWDLVVRVPRSDAGRAGGPRVGGRPGVPVAEAAWAGSVVREAARVVVRPPGAPVFGSG